MKSFKFFLATVVFGLLSQHAKAQLLPSVVSQVPVSECDYCGCAQGISPLETGSTGVRLEYSTLYLNAQYQGSQKQPNPSKQYEVLQAERASFYYRFAGSPFTASLEVPYVERQSRVVQDPTMPLYTSGASGVGDIIARMRYTHQHYVDESTIAYSASFGIQFPTGKTDIAPSGGGFLDPDLEPGFGTTNFLFGANVFWSFDRIGFGVNASVGILTGKGAPEDSGQFHKYGNFLNGEISFRYRILPADISESNLSITLALGAETRAHETQGGQDITASGGSLVFVTPGLKYIASQSLSADVSFHIPVYENLAWDAVAGAMQFGETYRIVAGIQFIL
ncbi:MAG: hypothetical protein ACHQM6_02195 [Candidatus Kapaibacterium sp.]